MNPQFWKAKRVLITGGTGFIGSHLTRLLSGSGAVLSVTTRSGRSKLHGTLVGGAGIEYLKGDLRDQEFADRSTSGKDIVFHLASNIAGLAYNARHPAEMMASNTMLDVQVLHASARNKVKLFFYPSGALVYDSDAPVPVREDASTVGPPVEACRGAAWAKRFCEKAIPLFRDEYGMKSILARFSNIYGPGDTLDPARAHLIGNVIRAVSAGESPEIWGDGSKLRSFLYVTTAVETAVSLVEAEATDGPINVGGQSEHTVREIVEEVIEISGKPLKPTYRPGRPRGLDRKLLSVDRLRKLIGFEECLSLREGLRATYEWYRSFEGRAD